MSNAGMKGQRDTASFLLRFTQDLWEDNVGDPHIEWRGVIRHVQTDKEQRFTDFAEATAFIQQCLMQLTLDSVQNGHHGSDASAKASKDGEDDPSAVAAVQQYQEKALRESYKLWEKFATNYTDIVVDIVQQSAENSRQQTEAIQRQVAQTIEQAQATMLQPWRFFSPFTATESSDDEPQNLPSSDVLETLTKMQQQLELLVEKVSHLEAQLPTKK